MRKALCLLFAAGCCHAQEVATQSGEPSKNLPAVSGDSPSEGSSFLGMQVPGFDPGSEIVHWNGKSWNISDNRIFEARFEKFLNAPEAAPDSDLRYNRILAQILDLLAPDKSTPKSTDEAFRLLAQAAQFDNDARLCDSIANQVEAARNARQSSEKLAADNAALEKERKRLEWNSKMTTAGKALDSSSGSDGVLDQWRKEEKRKEEQSRLDADLQPMTARLAEVNALLKANHLKREAIELQVKIEFQALIVQHFLLRRFQHVLIGTRFYRGIFSDGDSILRVGRDAQSLFSNAAGLPPTVGTLDSLANEALRDGREGVRAFLYLLKKSELESATKRLAETFVPGEYLPEIRAISRDDKRRALDFIQKSNQLISAIDLKDYTLAENLIKDLKKSAKDFDSSKPVAAIETARTVASMHIAKAKNAAVSGDKATVESELKSATGIWPRNPALAEVGGMIFSQSDVQQRAITDFDQLLGQKNYRQISDDKMRFIAATATFPEKQEQLRKVLDDMAQVEAAVIRAQEVEKRGDFAGAWESAEAAYRQFPEDNKLNQIRANLTTRASDFVRALKQAEEQEKKDQLGSSLAWYLKAQKDYPASDFARQGIERINTQILPDAK